ncbi:MAG: NADH-quinone oxidoreductase subunit H [Caldisericia bacterium]
MWYNVEFAGIRFVFFFFAEYTYLFVTGALVTTFYLGGGYMPGWFGTFLFNPHLTAAFWFIVKIMFNCCSDNLGFKIITSNQEQTSL